MAELAMTPGERQALKARAHALKPVVLLGAAGLSEMALREIDRALTAHELVKIKLAENDREQRALMFTIAAETLAAAKVQLIGKTIVLFRPLPENEEKQVKSETPRLRRRR